MKKLMIVAVVVVLTAITAVYSQTGPKGMPPLSGITYVPRGNTFRIQSSINTSMPVSTTSPVFTVLAVDFEGKINGKPIEFTRGAPRGVVMNDGDLSDDEHRLVETGMDLIVSAFYSRKLEMPEMNFELKAINEGDALLATVKPLRGGAVFEGKFSGGVSYERFKFKQDAAGTIIVNNGTMPEDDIRAIELTIIWTKLYLDETRARSKQ